MFASDELPPELPEEGVRTLVDAVNEDLRKMGLYLNGVAVNVDQDEDPTSRKHSLMMQCAIGDVAFSKRVQSPEDDSFDMEFRKIEIGTQDDTVLDIMKRYKEGYEIEIPEDDGED